MIIGLKSTCFFSLGFHFHDAPFPACGQLSLWRHQYNYLPPASSLFSFCCSCVATVLSDTASFPLTLALCPFLTHLNALRWQDPLF